MRLIDADAYLKKVCTYNETGCGSCRLQTKCPVDEPTVDAVPVRHGHWKPIPSSCGTSFECSECEEKTTETVMGKPRYEYCPMCGARMDEE